MSSECRTLKRRKAGTMNLGTEVLVIFLVVQSLHTGSSQLTGTSRLESCTANGGVPGRCTFIKNCTAAVGYLRANVSLSLCNVSDPSIVCCPTEKRISRKKCEKFKDVLRKPSSAIPLLPLPFLMEESPSEVVCDPNLNPLISDGRDAKIDEMPFMVAVGYNVSTIPWRCGGTLISEDFALTAAHCVVNQNAGPPTQLLFGDITLNEATSNTRELMGVSEVFVHPNYQPPRTYHDIALIKMSRKMKISKSIMPACLPQAEDDLLKKVNTKNFTAAGFGITGANEAQSNTLQVVNLRGYDWDTCNAFYKEIPTWKINFPSSNGPRKHIYGFPKGITRTQICSGDAVGRKDTCQGDSGGPLLLPDKNKRCIFNVVGITSFGPNQCGDKAPAVYTNVLSYLDWIEDVVWRSTNQQSTKYA